MNAGDSPPALCASVGEGQAQDGAELAQRGAGGLFEDVYGARGVEVVLERRGEPFTNRKGPVVGRVRRQRQAVCQAGTRLQVAWRPLEHRTVVMAQQVQAQ